MLKPFTLGTTRWSSGQMVVLKNAFIKQPLTKCL